MMAARWRAHRILLSVLPALLVVTLLRYILVSLLHFGVIDSETLDFETIEYKTHTSDTLDLDTLGSETLGNKSLDSATISPEPPEPPEPPYVASLARTYAGLLTPGEAVEPSDLPTLSIIILGPKAGRLHPEFRQKLVRSLGSLAEQLSGPMRLLVLTDRASVAGAAALLGGWLAGTVARAAVLARGWRWARRRPLPAVTVTYVATEPVVEKHQDFIQAIRSWSDQLQGSQ
jgi:hypothetical protein